MVPSSDQSALIEASLEELRHIATFLRGREVSGGPTTALIGGWAVHSYNPWYGSIDIDLVTNHRTRSSLNNFLRGKRGYVFSREPTELKRVVKPLPPYGQIKIDFASREIPDPFEGVEYEMDYSYIDDYCDLRLVGSGAHIHVPRRSLLLLFKMKAAWDRGYRITHNTSSDPSWELSKLRKDRADILALVDPSSGGDEVDVYYLGEKLERYDFLMQVLEDVMADGEAIEWYGRMSADKAKGRIERLLSLLR